jgi:hypothetical protein
MSDKQLKQLENLCKERDIYMMQLNRIKDIKHDIGHRLNQRYLRSLNDVYHAIERMMHSCKICINTIIKQCGDLNNE